MKNKKGVSPLLAAVLLIAFSIVLAAIVSNFVIKKTKEFKPDVIAEESVYCDSVSLGYKIDPGTYGIGNDLIEGIILVNKGTFSIYQLLINTPGLPSITVRLLDTADSSKETPISPSGKYPIKLQVGSSPEVKIIPIIKDSDTGNFVKCSNKELIINLYGLSGGNAEEIATLIKTDSLPEDIALNAIILGVSEETMEESTSQAIGDVNQNKITDTTEIGVMIQIIETTS